MPIRTCCCFKPLSPSEMKPKRIIIMALSVSILGLFCYKSYRVLWAVNVALNAPTVDVYIPSDPDFGMLLTAVEPYLKRPSEFVLLAQIKRLDQYPKPGHYVLKHGMSNLALVEQLRSANEPIVLKFNNQERLEDLVGTLSRQIEPDSLELLMAFKNQEFLTKAQMNSETLLTLFVPNSYEVYWNVSAEGIGQRMLTEYRAFWNADRLEKAKAINLTPTQVVILASIVQKESVKPSERAIIAGVYLNRLRRNMPLQADPTVIFAKKKMENDYQQIIRRVLYKDLTLDSPYNTYKYAGLPPGPITMPDINSIDAVLNAEHHRYLYFVADPNRPGFHDFSRSLSQHNRKRRAYVNWIKKQGIKR